MKPTDHRTNTEYSNHVTDTIAAVSTPHGEGGIGVVRLSGPQAVTIAERLFLSANREAAFALQSRRLYYGHIRHPETGEAVDEVLLSVMRAPHSYTREDVVEISGHGGPAPLRAILTLALTAGARLAEPGEFTQRAFLNGRIDLTQAEAVLDTIRARTDAGLRAAQQVLAGQLGGRVRALRLRLVSLLSALEVAIDYADEDITELSPEEMRLEIEAILAQTRELIASHARGKLLRDGAGTTIVGRPNTGKSSLLNALLGENRAIVTDVPGTTRDTIEEQIDLGGVPLRLIDTAGIRHTEHAVERIGVERSRASLETADLILLVLDRSAPLTDDDRELLRQLCGRPVVIILNKADLPAQISAEQVTAMLPAPLVEISTLTGSGICELKDRLRTMLLGPDVATEPVALANLRQCAVAERAALSLEQALETLDAGGGEELLAVDLMAAASALGEITGDDVREEVIRDLFARFCVGK
ncbi:MAG: tRNA uridine-5-carboxymethylaminomethyl(34) synthesis GTPase MnmE [Armatimonadota bacterium]